MQRQETINIGKIGKVFDAIYVDAPKVSEAYSYPDSDICLSQPE